MTIPVLLVVVLSEVVAVSVGGVAVDIVDQADSRDICHSGCSHCGSPTPLSVVRAVQWV